MGREGLLRGVEAIVTVLDPAWTRSVAATWRTIDTTLGLRGVLITPYPHFSYVVGGRLDRDALATRLSELAGRTAPFTAHVRGIATFAEPWPVVYLRVVPSARLRAFHRKIWERARTCVRAPIDYYRPGAWVPHITIAQGDEPRRRPLTAEDVARVKPLVPRDLLEGSVRVDNLTLIVVEEGRQVLGRRFVLTGARDSPRPRAGSIRGHPRRRAGRRFRPSPDSAGGPRHRSDGR